MAYSRASKHSQVYYVVSILVTMCCSIFIASYQYVQARVGVGVATGKIQLNEALKPGIVYDLPPLTVLNTGDEAHSYEVTIQYYETQDQLKPVADWFKFSPQTFNLEPGAGQAVNITITVPVKVQPGDYFAFLEGRPAKVASAETQVNVAAAAKLYFTIAPANFFQGLYYRTMSFIQRSAPWSYIVLVVVLLAAFIVLFKKYFTFNIGIGRKQ